MRSDGAHPSVGLLSGATLLAIASSHQAAPGKAALGIFAALGAGILWGTMYIPYRKAYLTGMNPLSFITFFTIGELATMTVLAVAYRGAIPLWHELVGAREVLFWLMLGGFVFSNTLRNTSASAAAFPSPTPISSGDCSGAFWFFMNYGAPAKRCTRKSPEDRC